MRRFCLKVWCLAIVAAITTVHSVNAGAYHDAVMAGDPVAYWRLGETNASQPAVNLGLLAGDDTSFGTYSDGALVSQPTLVAGETNGSFLAQAGSVVTTEEFEKFEEVAGFGGTGVSVEFWTAFKQLPTGFVNLVGDGMGGMNFNLMVYGGPSGFIRPHIQTDEGYSSIDSVRLLEAGEIVHVVSTWDMDSGDFRLYLDGTEAEVNPSGGIVPRTGFPVNTFNRIYVGQDGRELSPSAWLDEVAIYNYALTPATVLNHHNLGKGAPSPLPEPPQPFPDPGNLAGLPSGLVTYVDFDEASAPGAGGMLDYAYDRQGSNDGRFQGNAARVPGLIGMGAAYFDNTGGTQVSLGNGVDNSFSVTDGIAVETLIKPEWTGDGGDYDEIFRKEDGGNRILFSFQNDQWGGSANPPVEPGPVLSFGLNTGGYQELDMPLDLNLSELDGGNPQSGTIWLNDPGVALGPDDVVLNDGKVHHAVAAYDADSGEKSIWIDGVQRWSVVTAGDVVSGGGAIAYIGSSSGGENFNGTIDEFAFWNRALSAQEVVAHYANVQNGENYFGIGGVPGDFNGDGLLTTIDIDLLTTASATGSLDPKFDLNGDKAVNAADATLWIKGDTYAHSWIGDTDVDGQFNSGDFVIAFTAGKYETPQAAVWSEGDWNADGFFNSSDFVAAFADGGYEQGPRGAVAAVPEPSTVVSLLLGSLLLLLSFRRRVAT